MAMNTTIANHPIWGKTLFADNNTTKIGIPLEFGIRISYLSYKNSENLFYEQPNDAQELCTPEGFRVRGGHRLWLAPESEKVYYPDNDAIEYEIIENSIILRQTEDPWLGVKKSMEITFAGDAEIHICHKVTNTERKLKSFALWPITSVAPGGIERIPLRHRENGYDPLHTVTMWDYTNLGDERAAYTRECITLSHKPLLQKYKIGIGHPNGPITYENKGVVFEKSFALDMHAVYPDGGVSFETFMCAQMVEIESLSPLFEIGYNDSAEFHEIWKLK